MIVDRAAVALVGLAPELAQSVAGALQVEASCRIVLPIPAEAADAASGRPAVAAVSVENDAVAAFRYISQLAGAGTRVIAVGPGKDADVILKSMRAGASEFAIATELAEVVNAIRAQLRPLRGHVGSVATVFAAKGGIGATTIAVNLAGAIQRRGGRACLVDLNVNLGDAMSFLDLSAGYWLTDVASNMHRLDRDLLDSSLPMHTSGLHVVAQSGKLEDADRLDAPTVTAIIDFLRHHYDWTIVDGVRGFDTLPLAALDVSERIFLVAAQDVPSIRNARRCVELFRRLGYADGRVQLIINRHQQRSRIPDSMITETVGLPIAARISNDFAAASEALHKGDLLASVAPRSAATKDLDGLVQLLGVETTAIEAGKSFLKRLFTRTVPNGA